MDRFGLSPRERRALSAAIYLLPIVIALLIVALVRDMWPPFRQIAVMFFLGWLLAFLLDPIVSAIVERVPRLPRGPAAAITFLLVAVLLVGAVGLVALSFTDSLSQVISSGTSVDQAVTDVLASVQSFADSLGFPLDVDALLDDLVESGREQLGGILSGALGGALTVLTMGMTIAFIAVVIVASKASFLTFTRRLVPPDRLDLFDALARALDRSFGGYMRGQFGLAALYGLFVSVVAVVFGVPFVPFIGVTTALLQSIPFFGQLVSWMPLVLVTVVFSPDDVVGVVAIMVVGWLLMQNVVSPRVMGATVGLNPLVVLAAVFIGGALAGPLGAVFGVPVLAALGSVFTAWLDHVRPESALPPPPEPDEDVEDLVAPHPEEPAGAPAGPHPRAPGETEAGLPSVGQP